ncbi:MAG: hypothetical protein ILA17_05375 [Ruminococcus sp.]|nr:hypothetical protein [Ruminococcus sp.]
MTKKILTVLLALAMLTATACTQDNSSEPARENSSSASDSSLLDSDSENSSSDADDISDSSSENSTTTSETTTTTTTTSATTTTENSTTTTTKAQAPTTTKNTTQATTQATAKPVQTTKATTKATTKVTTKATTKATQATTDLSKLTPYWRALYNMTTGKTTKQDCEVVRNELLAYGKKLYPQFAINTKLHPLITKDGKYTDSFTEAEGGTNSDTEYYTVTPYGDVGLYYPYKSETERWNTMKWFDTSMKTVIKNTLQDRTRYDVYDDVKSVWYITYGFENKGGGVGTYSWVCMTAFADNWK